MNIPTQWTQTFSGSPIERQTIGESGAEVSRIRCIVFITTSGFTAQGIDFARSVEGMVLVDGSRLVNLMMDHEVGVTSRLLKLPSWIATTSMKNEAIKLLRGA